MKEKSKKDLAFDKERAKYRHQIRELEIQLRQKDIDIREKEERVIEVERKNAELQDWIDRLLEYTEMSKEDLKMLVEGEKTKTEVAERLNAMFKVTSLFGGRYL